MVGGWLIVAGCVLYVWFHGAISFAVGDTAGGGGYFYCKNIGSRKQFCRGKNANEKVLKNRHASRVNCPSNTCWKDPSWKQIRSCSMAECQPKNCSNSCNSLIAVLRINHEKKSGN